MAIYEENDELVSYYKLMAYIKETHPRDEQGRAIPVCATVGCLPCCGCCWKTEKNPRTREDTIRITKMAQQIGIGPQLLLMVTKSFAWLFFVLTIFNLPVFFFFFSGNVARR